MIRGWFRFPRPHRRGPIEARSARDHGRFLDPFRGLTAAAPLKPPSWSSHHNYGRFPFRGLTAAAPLKLRVVMTTSQLDDTAFRGLTAAAPLKLS